MVSLWFVLFWIMWLLFCFMVGMWYRLYRMNTRLLAMNEDLLQAARELARRNAFST